MGVANMIADRVSWKENSLYRLCSELYQGQGKWEKRYAEMSLDEHKLFDHACCFVLLMHGAPPPYPNTFDSEQYLKRNTWMMQVERTLMDSFKLHPGHIGPFIAVYEKWYRTTMEEE